jgi:DNA-binding SARP family transcriptional activator
VVASSEAVLGFRILGPVQALSDGTPVQLARKPRGVLAILLLNANTVVPADRLVEELWAGSPPPSGPGALQVYVSQLRKALGGGAVVTRDPGYLLELAPDQLDLSRFERLAADGRKALAADRAEEAASALRAALALWQGPALADFGYEPFAQGEIARLDELRLAALEDRVDADLALGGHGELVGELEALVGEHPLRERLRGQLMLALYRSGRQAQALAQYRSFRQTLTSELGIEPSSALRALEHSMLVQDRALDLAHVNEPRATPVHRRVIARWRATGYASTSTRLQPTVIISTSG